ncbi:hypothetical protein B0H19DRAFT_1083110 [Mycena capillaripes]|nr:hypothetical protein B0H19DRAFT_1083110 [Mycena capillaripes]
MADERDKGMTADCGALRGVRQCEKTAQLEVGTGHGRDAAQRLVLAARVPFLGVAAGAQDLSSACIRFGVHEGGEAHSDESTLREEQQAVCHPVIPVILPPPPHIVIPSPSPRPATHPHRISSAGRPERFMISEAIRRTGKVEEGGRMQEDADLEGFAEQHGGKNIFPPPPTSRSPLSIPLQYASGLVEQHGGKNETSPPPLALGTSAEEVVDPDGGARGEEDRVRSVVVDAEMDVTRALYRGRGGRRRWTCHAQVVEDRAEQWCGRGRVELSTCDAGKDAMHGCHMSRTERRELLDISRVLDRVWAMPNDTRPRPRLDCPPFVGVTAQMEGGPKGNGRMSRPTLHNPTSESGMCWDVLADDVLESQTFDHEIYPKPTRACEKAVVKSTAIRSRETGLPHEKLCPNEARTGYAPKNSRPDAPQERKQVATYLQAKEHSSHKEHKVAGCRLSALTKAVTAIVGSSSEPIVASLTAAFATDQLRIFQSETKEFSALDGLRKDSQLTLKVLTLFKGWHTKVIEDRRELFLPPERRVSGGGLGQTATTKLENWFLESKTMIWPNWANAAGVPEALALRRHWILHSNNARDDKNSEKKPSYAVQCQSIY